MDTSVDQASPTLDFILGQGVNFPVPTDEDFARLLFSVLDELRSRYVLADLIGNCAQDHPNNYVLNQALSEASRRTNAYPSSVRAKEVYQTSRVAKDGDESIAIDSRLYIACTRTDDYWLLVEISEAKHKTHQPYAFTQLDINSMTKFLSHYSHYGDHVGIQILRELTATIRHRLSDWEDKQRRLSQAAEFLNFTTERTVSANTTPYTSGTGIEG